jgi:hypothetical protein
MGCLQYRWKAFILLERIVGKAGKYMVFNCFIAFSIRLIKVTMQQIFLTFPIVLKAKKKRKE